MPRSIDGHKKECPCPACVARRRGTGATQVLTVRLSPDVRAWLLERPEGARAWIEAHAAREMTE